MMACWGVGPRATALRVAPGERSGPRRLPVGAFAEDRSAERRPPPSATGRPSVRPGSVPQRSSMGSSGHQRSPTVQRNRRSLALQLTQLR
jgi:hypothetical protein